MKANWQALTVLIPLTLFIPLTLLISLTQGCSSSRSQMAEQQGGYGDSSESANYQMQAEMEQRVSAVRERIHNDNDKMMRMSAPSADSSAPSRPQPAPMAVALSTQGYTPTGGSTKSYGSKTGSSSGSGGSGASYPTPPSQPPIQQQQHETVKIAPSVIYQGYLRLRVRRTLEAIDAATKAAIEGGGYVQMQSASTLIVRMPATDFDAAMLKFANLGEVLQRQIQAVDVSKQVTDLDARLAVATQSRARLLELLKTVKDVEERLQVLEEIKRLTEQMETMQSSLATLRNLSNFFTITIDFESLVNGATVASHASPFDWIRNLTAHRVTLNDGHEHVHMTPPQGFVQFDEKFVLFGDTGAWRAQASDTAMLRAASVTNDPKGDALFWARAVEFEMDGRDEALVDSCRRGQLEVRVFKNKDAKPRWWLIATTSAGDKTWVVEAFFPDEAAYKAHGDAVLAALATFGAD
jgi:hypothetical protein